MLLNSVEDLLLLLEGLPVNPLKGSDLPSEFTVGPEVLDVFHNLGRCYTPYPFEDPPDHQSVLGLRTPAPVELKPIWMCRPPWADGTEYLHPPYSAEYIPEHWEVQHPTRGTFKFTRSGRNLDRNLGRDTRHGRLNVEAVKLMCEEYNRLRRRAMYWESRLHMAIQELAVRTFGWWKYEKNCYYHWKSNKWVDSQIYNASFWIKEFPARLRVDFQDCRIQNPPKIGITTSIIPYGLKDLGMPNAEWRVVLSPSNRRYDPFTNTEVEWVNLYIDGVLVAFLKVQEGLFYWFKARSDHPINKWMQREIEVRIDQAGEKVPKPPNKFEHNRPKYSMG